MITNYIPDMCGYGLNNLKKVVHIFSESANVIHIDNGEAYVTSGITDLQTISATSVSFEETTAYDDRFKFQKTVTATVNGFSKLSALGGKYYVVLEDVNGIMWLVNADFPSLATYTYTLQDGTDETVFTFSALSNFPTLKLNASINNAYACQNYSLVRVDEIKMLEKRYANINAQSGLIYGYSSQVYKTVRPYRNSIKVEETFDGTNANTAIQFSIGLDDYQNSWHYNMLEYPYNKYVAVIDHLACGFEMGLVPSYNVQGSHQIGGGDTVTVTLVGGSQRGSEWAESWMEVTVAPVYEWRLSDEWMCQPVEYRWTESGYTCIGYDKYQNNIKEVSTDGGETWSVMLPEEYSASTLIEEYSSDCGWPPTREKYRFILYDSTVVTGECNTTGASIITTTDVPNGIVSASIGDCVTRISDYAFRYHTSLTSVTIPDSVTSIGEQAFRECTGLTSVMIGSGVTYIGGSAFHVGIAAPSVTIYATTPPTVGESAFKSLRGYPIYVPCESVSAYKRATGWSTYASRIEGIPPCGQPTPTINGKYQLTLNNSNVVTADCDSTSAITSGRVATQYSGSVVSAVIGDCVTTIGQFAFGYCSSLTSITIPDSVTSIGDYTFNNCRSLTSITIPSGVTRIGSAVFYECSGLTSIEIPTGVTSIGVSAFYRCSSLLSITIPSGVTKIGAAAFQNCSSLTSITIPSGVTYIGQDAFYNCSGLTSIEIPTGVTSIENAAFGHCTGLTSCNIGSGVTSIGQYAFGYCSSLTSITIPSGVTSISIGAFINCSSLTSITVNATTPPGLANDAFLNTNDCPIYVPSSAVETYKSTTGWSSYASRIYAIPGS